MKVGVARIITVVALLASLSGLAPIIQRDMEYGVKIRAKSASNVLDNKAIEAEARIESEDAYTRFKIADYQVRGLLLEGTGVELGGHKGFNPTDGAIVYSDEGVTAVVRGGKASDVKRITDKQIMDKFIVDLKQRDLSK